MFVYVGAQQAKYHFEISLQPFAIDKTIEKNDRKNEVYDAWQDGNACAILYNGDCKNDHHRYAAVAQSVVRRIGSAEVTGPIPVSSCF